MNVQELLWVEKYRPKTVDECILPENIKKSFQGFLKKKDFPNLLLSGNAGVGKTSIAKALVNELDMDLMFINGSLERNIDMVRTKIMEFGSTVSLMGNKKVVIIDESDGIGNIAQQSMRGVIEQFKNTRFIFTCNYKNQIIDAIHSRCNVIDFNLSKEDKKEVATNFFKRVLEILDKENIEYDKKVVANLVKKYFPDNRRILNELQRYSSCGKIDVGILTSINSVNNLVELFKILKEKDYRQCINWLSNNLDTEPTHLFRSIYDIMFEYVNKEDIPSLVLLLAEYQEKSAFVADQEINTLAFLTEVMGNIGIK